VYTGKTDPVADSYRLVNWKQVNTALWAGEKHEVKKDAD
jgi:hypothetical protein